ncbi:MAG: NAD(P)-dependent oxidoreductase [Rhodocyclaceae bacterium]|nr:NAD(P)-dependent oxidoreductase [Rhodocyclaceae bacterium]
MEVGFVGLGAMGRPMLERLLGAGHKLAVYARRIETAKDLLNRGVRLCASPAYLAATCDVVFVAVTGTSDVEHLVRDDDGLLEGARAGMVIVDTSTIAPASARALASVAAGLGVDMLDAPVSGGSIGARDGTLSIMVGGEAAVLERVRPLLAVLGKTIVHMGGAGCGQVAKACNQLVLVAAIQACAEAAMLARASGVDFARVREAMLAGSAASGALDAFGGRMARREFAAGVQARLHHKDYALIADLAAQSYSPLPISAAVQQQLNALMALGLGGEDTSALLKVLEATRSADA